MSTPPALAPPAEPGLATTEFQLAVANAAQAVLVVLVSFGIHITDAQRAALLAAESALVTLGFAAYALARGIRKHGTPG